MIRPVALLILFSSLAALAQGQTNSIFSIRIDARGDNVAEVEGFLKKGLQSLKDVDIAEAADPKPAYTVQVAVLKTDAARGSAGFALSFVTQFHGAEKWVHVEDHQLVMAETDALKAKCEEYIAWLDAKVLQPHRKIFQDVRKVLAE